MKRFTLKGPIDQNQISFKVVKIDLTSEKDKNNLNQQPNAKLPK